MSRLNERDIAKELAESESFEPPAGLLEKIKAEIPQEVRVGTAVPGTVSRSFVPRQRWPLAIAASLLVGVGAGIVAMRTWESKGEQGLRVQAQAHLAAPRSVAAKAPPPAAPAVPAPPPPPSSKADESLSGAPAAKMAEVSRMDKAEAVVVQAAPAPAPKPEAADRQALESLGYLSVEKQRVQQPAKSVEVPAESQPAPPATRAASPPALNEVEGRVENGAVGGAPASVENEAPRRKAVARDRLLSSSSPQLKKEKDQKTRKAFAARFESAGTDSFLNATAHPSSTFGVDVDTASYAMARRALEEGRLPDPASVRVEEWLSAFDYGDPAPVQGHFAIRAEGSPSPFSHGPLYRLLRFNVKGPLQTVAGKARVEFNSVVVERYRLLGSENGVNPGEHFGEEIGDDGQPGAGRGVTVLYEIELRKNAPHWEQPVATLYLRYQVTGSGTPKETVHRVGFQEFAPFWEQASPALRLTTLVAEMAEILKGSPWAKQADLGDVARRIQEVAPRFPGDRKVAELADLAARAARLKASRARPEE